MNPAPHGPAPARRRGPGLRTRLFAAMVVVAVGALVVSGVMTLVLARGAAYDTARSSLRREAPRLAARVESLGRALRTGEGGPPRREVGLRAVVLAALEVSRAGVVTVTPEGEVVEGLEGLAGEAPSGELLRRARSSTLPPGVEPGDLDVDALAAGSQVSGRGTDRDVVFVAEPLTPTAAGRAVLVLSEPVSADPARRAAGWFLVAAAVALTLAAAAAFVVSRFLTLRLARMDAAARRIAAGDLSARVSSPGDHDDELGRLAAAFDEMAAGLERSRDLERAFLLSVSHDLRTPLTSIRGYAEGLLDGTIEGDEPTRHAAEVVVSESRRLERLVADLLDLARLDAHRFSLSAAPCDAAAVVRRTAEGFAPSATDLGLTLRIDETGPVAADIDAERLGQLVANLVENALKYARTTVAVHVDGGGEPWFSVRVSDDGPGVPAAEQARVFERLYQARDASGRRIGTGLGLAIARDLAGAMGGTVELAAPVPPVAGETPGATFVVRLPTGADRLQGTARA